MEAQLEELEREIMALKQSLVDAKAKQQLVTRVTSQHSRLKATMAALDKELTSHISTNKRLEEGYGGMPDGVIESAATRAVRTAVDEMALSRHAEKSLSEAFANHAARDLVVALDQLAKEAANEIQTTPVAVDDHEKELNTESASGFDAQSLLETLHEDHVQRHLATSQAKQRHTQLNTELQEVQNALQQVVRDRFQELPTYRDTAALLIQTHIQATQLEEQLAALNDGIDAVNKVTQSRQAAEEALVEEYNRITHFHDKVLARQAVIEELLREAPNTRHSAASMPTKVRKAASRELQQALSRLQTVYSQLQDTFVRELNETVTLPLQDTQLAWTESGSLSTKTVSSLSVYTTDRHPKIAAALGAPRTAGPEDLVKSCMRTADQARVAEATDAQAAKDIEGIPARMKRWTEKALQTIEVKWHEVEEVEMNRLAPALEDAIERTSAACQDVSEANKLLEFSSSQPALLQATHRVGGRLLSEWLQACNCKLANPSSST